MKRVLLALGLVASMAIPEAVHAQQATCQFILGFKTLHDLDAADVGDCIDNQAFAPNGDAQQHTTKGLMAWRKADNWTAFTNGYRTWINGPSGLVSRLNTDRFPWEAATPPQAPVPAPPASGATAPSSAPAASVPASGSANVTVSDTTFSPINVTVAVGGTVTWTNNGSLVHAAASPLTGPQAFDTGGLGSGQSGSLNFPAAGTFAYTSPPDCLQGAAGNPAFNCGGAFSVTVVAAGTQVAATTPVPPVAASAPPSTAAAPVAAGPAQGNATVTMSDTTFSPINVTVSVGGTVTWTNNGTLVHAAASPLTGPQAFDSGGIGSGQSASVNFPTAGTFAYTSPPDCLQGAAGNPVFNCGAGYTVTVR